MVKVKNAAKEAIHWAMCFLSLSLLMTLSPGHKKQAYTILKSERLYTVCKDSMGSGVAFIVSNATNVFFMESAHKQLKI